MSKELSRRQFLGFGAAAVGAVALAGCSGGESSSSSSTSSTASSSSSSEKTVRIGTTNDGHVFSAVADAQGYFAEEGIKMETSFFSTSDDAFQALFSGKIDMVSNMGTNLPLVHIAQGQDLTIFGGYMLTGCMPIIAPTGTVWNGVEDLIGKNVACDGSEFGLFGPLIDKGHKFSEVTITRLSTQTDRVESVATGKCDYALCGTTQNYNISQNPNVEVMCYQSDVTPNYSCCRVECTGEWLENNEETVQGLMRAWIRAQDWYESHKEESKQIIMNNTNGTYEFVSAYVDNEHYRLDLDPVRKSCQRAWKWMSEMDLFPEGYDKIDVDAHINTDIYEKALNECAEKYGDQSRQFYDDALAFFAENN